MVQVGEAGSGEQAFEEWKADQERMEWRGAVDGWKGEWIKREISGGDRG